MRFHAFDAGNPPLIVASISINLVRFSFLLFVFPVEFFLVSGFFPGTYEHFLLVFFLLVFSLPATMTLSFIVGKWIAHVGVYISPFAFLTSGIAILLYVLSWLPGFTFLGTGASALLITLNAIFFVGSYHCSCLGGSVSDTIGIMTGNASRKHKIGCACAGVAIIGAMYIIAILDWRNMYFMQALVLLLLPFQVFKGDRALEARLQREKDATKRLMRSVFERASFTRPVLTQFIPLCPLIAWPLFMYWPASIICIFFTTGVSVLFIVQSVMPVIV